MRQIAVKRVLVFVLLACAAWLTPCEAKAGVGYYYAPPTYYMAPPVYYHPSVFVAPVVTSHTIPPVVYTYVPPPVYYRHSNPVYRKYKVEIEYDDGFYKIEYDFD